MQYMLHKRRLWYRADTENLTKNYCTACFNI